MELDTCNIILATKRNVKSTKSVNCAPCNHAVSLEQAEIFVVEREKADACAIGYRKQLAIDPTSINTSEQERLRLVFNFVEDSHTASNVAEVELDVMDESAHYSQFPVFVSDTIPVIMLPRQLMQEVFKRERAQVQEQGRLLNPEVDRGDRPVPVETADPSTRNATDVDEDTTTENSFKVISESDNPSENPDGNASTEAQATDTEAEAPGWTGLLQ